MTNPAPNVIDVWSVDSVLVRNLRSGLASLASPVHEEHLGSSYAFDDKGLQEAMVRQRHCSISQIACTENCAV